MRPLLLLLLLLSSSAWACECGPNAANLPFQARADSAWLIVNGRVLSQWLAGGRQVFQLQPTRIWKGRADSLTLSLTTSLDNCGARLRPGEEYVFFFYGRPVAAPDPLAVDLCSRIELVGQSADLGLLKARFDPAFRRQLGQNATRQLSPAEAEFFAGVLPGARFDFAGKRLAIVSTALEPMTKARYFEQYATSWAHHTLVVFSAEEQAASGYDAAVILWRKMPVGQPARLRLLQQLTSHP